MRHFISKLWKKFSQFLKTTKTNKIEPIIYRVANIEQDEDENYSVVIQIIGKGLTFKSKPEKILSDDKLINNFSQQDVRNLTYLGYLNTNRPKYKVIAKKHAKNLDKMVFAIHKTGEKNAIVKTADQISGDEEIMASLSQKDAHMVGYITATEQTLLEAEQKKKLKKELLEKKVVKEIAED